MLRDQPASAEPTTKTTMRELEDALAAEEVAELAVDGQADGGGEQIGGDRPGHPVQAVQLADDLGQRGGDDHLLQRGEEQGEHQGGEDQADPAGAESGGGPSAGGGVAGVVVGSSFTSVIAPMRTAPLVALTAQFPR